MAKYNEIRCPSLRPHKIHKNSDIVFELCGALIGAAQETDLNDDFIVYCSVCHKFWCVKIDSYGAIEISPVDGKIDMQDKVKAIN